MSTQQKTDSRFTTIPIRPSTKEQFDALKDGRSADDTLERLITLAEATRGVNE